MLAEERVSMQVDMRCALTVQVFESAAEACPWQRGTLVASNHTAAINTASNHTLLSVPAGSALCDCSLPISQRTGAG